MSDLRTLTVLRKLIVDTVNADPHLPFGHLDDEVAEKVAAAVLAQFNGLGSAEVTTEWGVRWPAETPLNAQIESDGSAHDGGESYARRVHRQYPETDLICHEVRRGPWVEASS